MYKLFFILLTKSVKAPKLKSSVFLQRHPMRISCVIFKVVFFKFKGMYIWKFHSIWGVEHFLFMLNRLIKKSLIKTKGRSQNV